MKIVFFSGDDDALPILESLTTGLEVLALVTNPPKPKGRGLKIRPSLLGEFAQKKGINLFYPKDPNEKEFVASLERLEADCGVLVAFRSILGPNLLNLFPRGFLNLHPSLLPKYRGPAPIQRAILNGEKRTGVTIFFMNERVDSGPIIQQREVMIGENETYGELKRRLFSLGAEMLKESLSLIERNEVKPIPQNDALASYAPKIKKEECRISWREEKEFIHNQIRAFSPEPGAYTFFRGKRVIILRSEIPREEVGEEGEGIIVSFNGNLFVSTRNGTIKIKELKVEGKGVISGQDFINGYKPKAKERFG